MHESERNRLGKRLRAFQLAARDLDQAAFAAERLDQENDGRVRLLLTTAMVVTYMRPFTKSSLLDLRSFAPTASRDGQLHGRLDQLRDEVYAHTDKEADRRVAFGIGNEAASEGDWIPYAEQIHGISRRPGARRGRPLQAGVRGNASRGAARLDRARSAAGRVVLGHLVLFRVLPRDVDLSAPDRAIASRG